MIRAFYTCAGTCLLSLLVGPTVLAVDITTNTVIDALSPLNGEPITARDGVSPPTEVTIVDGGSVEGFVLHDTSRLTLDGGSSTLLSTIADDSELEVLSGTIGCTEAVCDVIDFDAVLTITHTARLSISGGFIESPIRLSDLGEISIYGTGLSLVDESWGFRAVGQLADGSPLSLEVIADDPAAISRVTLNEIPEPCSFLLGLCCVWLQVFCKRS